MAFGTIVNLQSLIPAYKHNTAPVNFPINIMRYFIDLELAVIEG